MRSRITSNITTIPLNYESYEEIFLFKESSVGRVSLLKNTKNQDLIVKKEQRFLGKFLETEAELLKIAYINNVNVPRCLDISKEPNSETRIMLMSYTPGDLTAEGKLKSISLKERYQIIRQLIIQVYRLHQAGITHADLNLGNFLWYEQNVQLIDFGAARFDKGNHAEDIRKIACEIVEILTLKYPASPLELTKDELKAVESCLISINVDPGSVILDLEQMMHSSESSCPAISMDEVIKKSWINANLYDDKFYLNSKGNESDKKNRLQISSTLFAQQKPANTNILLPENNRLFVLV